MAEIEAVPYGTWEVLEQGEHLAILAVGTMVGPSLEAARRLRASGVEATVVNCRYLKPYDRDVFARVVAQHSAILTVEEGAVTNGFGAFMAREIALEAPDRAIRVQTLGIPDSFIEHGGRDELLAEMGLDADGIERAALALKGADLSVHPSRETA